ncbi:kelch-like protein 3 [Saccostrea echinata]|uniref:kelch-like protein 3 n=1 Tax=Saccostrea echinata TaxID=191078 RepID=UPI002A80CF2F|nr:kelch-like protein 3 [Saccostrea echinata]
MDTPFPRTMGSRSTHAMSLQLHLHDQMLSNSELCDVVLVVEQVEIRAHWNVLVMCPYFQSLYDSGLKEKTSGKIHLQIGKVPAVRTAISFLYTGIAEISYETVKDILEVADYFQIADLKSCCQSYLESVTMTVENCVQMCLLCSLYNLEFYNKVFEFLRGHLPDIMQQEDALTLTSESVLSLLTDKTLSYVEQMQFFEFILKWVEFDQENREEFFPGLFCSLDLKKIPKTILEKEIETYPLVVKNEKCQVHVLNTKMKYITGLIKEDDGIREAILVAGGCGQIMFENIFHMFPFRESMAVNTLLGYVLAEDRWIELAPLPYQMKQATITYCSKKKCLYVFDNGHQTFSSKVSVYKFDLKEIKWTSFLLEVPENYGNNTLHTILACAGKLYAIISSHVIQFGPQLVHQWSTFVMEVKEDDSKCEVKQTLFQRNENSHLVACVMQDRKICVLANKVGANPKRRGKSAKFYVYDTTVNRKYDQSKGAYWDNLMIPVGDEIVVTRMGKCSYTKYSMTTRKWKHIKEEFLPFPANPFESVEYSTISDGSNFYVIGGKGFKNPETISTTFCFNFAEKKWKNLQELPQPLRQSATCLIQLPSNLTKCHFNCPHCKFSPCRSRATYDIHYPIDDEDEEDEDDFDDGSGYTYEDDYASGLWSDDVPDYLEDEDYDVWLW